LLSKQIQFQFKWKRQSQKINQSQYFHLRHLHHCWLRDKYEEDAKEEKSENNENEIVNDE
jgi:hypothetical protein